MRKSRGLSFPDLTFSKVSSSRALPVLVFTSSGCFSASGYSSRPIRRVPAAGAWAGAAGAGAFLAKDTESLPRDFMTSDMICRMSCS